MLPHDELTQRALDDLYGLLDSTESAAIRAQLATPAGQRASEEAKRIHGLLASAAKVPFPEAKFSVPTTEPARNGRKVSNGWVAWVVAASVLFGLGIPLAAQLVGMRHLDQQVLLAQNDAERSRLALEQASAQWRQNLQDTSKEFQEAQTAYFALANNVQADVRTAYKSIQDKQLNVLVSGPAAITPGAPNSFKIETRDLAGKAVATKLSTRVIDQAGRVVFDDGTRDIRGVHTLKLPADLPLTPDRDLKLEVSAVSPNGPAGQLKQTVPLAPPVYLAHITSDKPLYQAGEAVRFRSLVLDRFRLQPPAEEMVFSMTLLDPQGAELNTIQGREHSLNEKGDSLPGLIAGEFALAETAAGGEYTLRLREAHNRLPEQFRKFLVNRYQPAQLQKELEFTRKSYGPADEVVAACKVSRVSGPVANQPVTAQAQVDGQNLPVTISGPTDSQGGVTVKFKLPAAIERGDASVTVNFTDGGANESLNKPVPVVVKKINVELYPEGGDLIAGVPNRVYFQVRTPIGKPAELRGKLVDAQGATVARLETLNDDKEPGINQGQGKFNFTPTAGATYLIEVEQPAGVTATVQLPAVKSEGVVLSAGEGVTADDQPFSVQVTSAEKDRTLVVGAYARGRLLDYERIVAPAGKLQMVELVAAPGFGGVTRITVFSETGEGTSRTLTPVAERLVYRKPTKKTVLRVEPDKAAYSPGDKVHMKVSAVDEKGAPATAIAMLGVVNHSVVTMADEKTFRSMPTHFLLTGEVEKSEDLEHVDVLLGEHPQAANALDLLLGVQGWRRFKEQGPDVPKASVAVSPSPHPSLEGRGMVARVAPATMSVDSFKAATLAVMDSKRSQLMEAQTRFERAALKLQVSEAMPPTIEEQQRSVEQAMVTANEAKQGSIQRWDTIRDIARKALPIVAIVALLVAMIAVVIGWLRSRRFTIATVFCCVASLALFGIALSPRVSYLAPADEEHYAAPASRMNRAEDLAIPNLEAKADRDGAGLGGGGDRPGGPPPAGGRALEPRSGVVHNPAPAATPAPATKSLEPTTGEFINPTAPNQINSIRRGTKVGGKPGDTKKAEQETRQALGKVVDRVGQMKDIPADKRKAPAEQAFREKYLRERFQYAIPPFVPGRAGDIDRTARDDAPASRRLRGFGNVFQSDLDIPTVGPIIVREYAHHHTAKPDGVRDDFTETVFWHPALILPSGHAEVAFELSDSVTRYQVLAAAHTADGRLGAVKTEIAARKPVSVEPKLPVEVTASDRIDVPVTFANDTDQSRSVKLTVESPGLASVGSQPSSQFSLAGNARERRILSFRPSLVEGTARLRLNVAGEDAVEMKLPVVPDGFPVNGSISGELRGSAVHTVMLPQTWVADTLKCEVALFPTPLADLQRGLDGLLKEPYGCFEQTSTTNYPNTLILDYLNETGQADSALISKAKSMLDRGYTRLVSFEVPKGAQREGYEWFGHAPAHEALTAYGLLQFRDMARVADVDKAMIARTRNYLMSRKDGKGGFQTSKAALDSFGRANEQVTNAYIVWAITESGKDDDVTAELNRLEREAKDSKDPYFLALVANALLNRGRADAAAGTLTKLVSTQAADGSLTGTTISITGSRGAPLTIETTSLAVMAWLKAGRATDYGVAMRNAAEWIGKQRKGTGSFGPTQSTIMALKALVSYAKANKQPPEAGEMTLSVGDKVITRLPYSPDAKEALVLEIPNAAKHLKPGENTLRITTSGKNFYPYTVSWTYQTLQPPSAANCAVKLTTKLQRAQLAEGDSTRLNVTLENVSHQGQGMATAIIGLPAGLKLPDDFKQLREMALPRDGKPGPIAAWELRGRELVLYWRDLAPDAKIELAIDVLANVPGQYRGPASRAYLYYDPDIKHWVPPLEASISAK